MQLKRPSYRICKAILSASNWLRIHIVIQSQTRMWANAQRDGCPAEYRWRPLFTTRVPCSNAAKTRNLLTLGGVPQTTEPIWAASGPKFTILWEHVRETLLLNKFFPIVDTCLNCKDIAQQNCAMVPRWQIFGDLCVLYFQRAVCSTFQTGGLNSH